VKNTTVLIITVNHPIVADDNLNAFLFSLRRFDWSWSSVTQGIARHLSRLAASVSQECEEIWKPTMSHLMTSLQCSLGRQFYVTYYRIRRRSICRCCESGARIRLPLRKHEREERKRRCRTTWRHGWRNFFQSGGAQMIVKNLQKICGLNWKLWRHKHWNMTSLTFVSMFHAMFYKPSSTSIYTTPYLSMLHWLEAS